MDPKAPIELNVAGKQAKASRRQAMQWVLAAVAASALPTATSGQQPEPSPKPPGGSSAPVVPVRPSDPPPGHPVAKGYGTDPNLVEPGRPGELWRLTFTPAQTKTATALADVIIPKDDLGPAASTVGVIPMLDEWVSAPYPIQQADRPIVIEGLAWIDAESNRRFTRAFDQLTQAQRHAICDDICYHGAAKPEFLKPAEFFSRFRGLVAGAYYSTYEGWKAIGYEGNVALKTFDGPPAEVLERLGVTQTVK
jgi:hypothetical protein